MREPMIPRPRKPTRMAGIIAACDAGGRDELTGIEGVGSGAWLANVCLA